MFLLTDSFSSDVMKALCEHHFIENNVADLAAFSNQSFLGVQSNVPDIKATVLCLGHHFFQVKIEKIWNNLQPLIQRVTVV